ncbi:amidohydrolase family protein [Pseudocolwellia sp. AS88]|uniref:amidohydrolase family protein n=1 Tax=Pseudocolwellia sp. AS88 TaxID=3063958 RepID=UPI0026EA11E6|nr:amidohydrolase family protein [Pseudocolwellia sp. AS88]MDO7083541.1 amidohydrolase family protein [Pseudocolwellia sp. AS88]
MNFRNKKPNKAKLLTLCLLTLSMSLASSVTFANSFVIKNAKVHTATQAGILNNATIVVKDGVITAINPRSYKVTNVIDAQGKDVTPGLIGSMNSLGLIEVNAVSGTRDASEKKADITFDTSKAFNPKSTLLPYARKGGVTSNVVSPMGGESMFRGQSFAVNLSGDFDSVLVSDRAVVIDLGASHEGSRATHIQTLINTLEDAQEKLTDKKAEAEKSDASDSEEKDKKEEKLKRDEIIINELLAGTKTLVAFAERATDLLVLVDIKQRFNLDVVIVGGSDAVLIQKQLVKADIPVIVNPHNNLPTSFDTLNSSLDTATVLIKAGLKVGLYIDDAHKLDQLRYLAGSAVANGVEHEDALEAITANLADIFKLNTGKIAVGKKADIVMWSADPFEISTKVERLWIEGEEASTKSRQDALRDRYTTDTEMPRAYTK